MRSYQLTHLKVIYPFINPSTYLSIHPSLHPSIHFSLYVSQVPAMPIMKNFWRSWTTVSKVSITTFSNPNSLSIDLFIWLWFIYQDLCTRINFRLVFSSVFPVQRWKIYNLVMMYKPYGHLKLVWDVESDFCVGWVPHTWQNDYLSPFPNVF